MKSLKVLTFSDQALPHTNHLKRSCKELDLKLEVVLHTPWDFNAIKIKLLHEYLQKENPDTLLLVVDALDVVILNDEETILEKFLSIDGDVIFSAESNYYFRNKKLFKTYWKKYPKNSTPYDYLNSGTFMGTAFSLSKMLDCIIEENELALTNECLSKVRSDQYLFSKFYVDNFYRDNGLTIRLDNSHELMGCTGGRFSVTSMKDLSKLQGFFFFIIERNLLKVFKLHKFQAKSKDYIKRRKGFYNKKTRTYPGIMHFPGTWSEFDRVLDSFQRPSGYKTKNYARKMFAVMISYLSFIISIFSLLIVGNQTSSQIKN